MRTFVLPDILPGYKPASSCFYYEFSSDESTAKSQIHFTTYCISMVHHGVKHLRSASGLEVFEKNSVLLFSPGNYVSYEIHEDADQPYQSVLFFFDSHLVQEFLTYVDKKGSLKSDAHGSPYLSFTPDEYLTTYARSMRNLSQAKAGMAEPMQKIKLLELLTFLYTQNPGQVISLLNRTLPPGTDRHLINIIENNIFSDLTLEDLAFLCNMSLSTFKRWFEKQYGESPGKLIKERRLREAADRIRISGKNPTEIFSEAGYADYSSFSHSFKKMFGVSPREYRQQPVS